MALEKQSVIGSVNNVEFSVIEKSLTKLFQEHFPSYTEGLVRGDPGGFVLSPQYARNAEQLRNFEPRSDDVWVVTFPKCGTTWSQELVWMVMNNCDQVGAQRPLNERSPFIEFAYFTPASVDEVIPPLHKSVTLEMINKMPSPRIIKTHLPLCLLHPKLLDTCKIVYVVRNPKDVIVSYYHHHRLFKLQTYTGTFDQFAQYLMDDELYYSPFFSHVLEAWAKRKHPNMLFMFYEDMKSDLRGQINQVADFLGKKLSSDQITTLVNHLEFETFSKNEAVNYETTRSAGFLNPQGKFIRNGKVGDWKSHFSPDLNKRVDEWIEKSLTGSDLKFIKEL